MDSVVEGKVAIMADSITGGKITKPIKSVSENDSEKEKVETAFNEIATHPVMIASEQIDEKKSSSKVETGSDEMATMKHPVENVSEHGNEEFTIDFDTESEFDETSGDLAKSGYENFPEVELDAEAIAKEEAVQQYIAANQDAMTQAMATWKNTLAERKHIAFIRSKEVQAEAAISKEVNEFGQGAMSTTKTVPCIGQCRHVSFSAGAQAKTLNNKKEEVDESHDEDDASDTASMRMIATALSIRRNKGAARAATAQAHMVDDTEENGGDETLIADEAQETENSEVVMEGGDAEDAKSTASDKTVGLDDGKSTASDEAGVAEDVMSSASEEIVKKPFNPAWIPMSRFNREHRNPVVVKPSKPLFTNVYGMSESERNVWLTDLMLALDARIETQDVEGKHGQELKKEIEAVNKELDCVSARQEYMSLIIQMFKDEPDKLTDEFRRVVEYRLKKIDREDRAAKERFAKLEVEWEKKEGGGD